MDAPLLRAEGPRRCCGPLRRVALCSIAQQFGRIKNRGTTPACNHWERVRCEDVLACTRLKTSETSSTISFVVTGGCSRCLSISWREEALGFTDGTALTWIWEEVPEGAHCRPIPISCTGEPSLRGCADVLLPPWPSFWSCWTKIAHFDIPAAENHGHARLPPS